MNNLKKELYAEFLGTLVLIALGAGVVAQVNLSGQQNGAYISINIAWGLAVTLALAVRRGFAWRKVVPYALAQTAGAFVASAIVFLVYREALNNFDGGVRAIGGAKGTAGIFATYPQPFLSIAGGLVDQIVGTAILILVIFALTDSRNSAPAANLAPVLIGFLVMAIGMCFGLNAGYAINPARDLGPRLFTAVGGWGMGVFSAGNYWFWVPIIGPLVGGVVGGVVYDLVIGNALAPRSDS